MKTTSQPKVYRQLGDLTAGTRLFDEVNTYILTDDSRRDGLSVLCNLRNGCLIYLNNSRRCYRKHADDGGILGFVLTDSNQMTMDEAIAELETAGAVREKREDRFGVTKTGWWMDGVYLAPTNDPESALEALHG